MSIDLGIASYLFGKVSDMTWSNLYDNLGIKKETDSKALKKALNDFRDYIINRHKENPNFEDVLKFWNDHQIAEEILKIRYSLTCDFSTYDELKKHLEKQFPTSINQKLLIDLMDELNRILYDKVKEISQFSQADVAVINSISNQSIPNSSYSESSMLELIDKLESLIKQGCSLIGEKEARESLYKSYIKKSRIKNLEFVPPLSSSMTFTAKTNYTYNYYLFQSFEFEGDFGSDPTVFLIYSENDNRIEVSTSQQGLTPQNLRVLKFESAERDGEKYKYNISKELCYYSNKGNGYDIRPFILVILNNDVMGFATITLINKSFKNGSTVSLPFSGYKPFIAQGRKLIWPNKNDLIKKLHEPQTGKVFYLDKDVVENVIEIKEYFLNSLKAKIRDALKQEYE